jgi:hypothetical protein
MALKETNGAAFYALMQGPDLEALLPIVYTPTIGQSRPRFTPSEPGDFLGGEGEGVDAAPRRRVACRAGR